MHHDDNGAPRRRKLSDILDGGADTLRDDWEHTEAATEFAPLPAGVYTARVIGGELFTAKSGTPGYKLTFRVLEGEHTDRYFWHDVWLTAPALPMAKRDLGKLGVTAVEQLDTPLPAGIRCTCKLALRREDDGTEHNRLRSFNVIGIDEPEVDPFAPVDDGNETQDAIDAVPADSDSAQASFEFGANAMKQADNAAAEDDGAAPTGGGSNEQ